MIIFLFAILANFWIWEIFSSNFILGFILILTSWLLYQSFKKNSAQFFLFFLLGIILFFQWKLTPAFSLTNLDNDQIRVKDMRLREYPPVFLKIGAKTLWIPAAHWLEQRKESIALYRLTDNFFSTLDINQYFFAGHPRERVEIDEFEKYPYIFLPFFIFGLFKIVEQKQKKIIIFIVLPIILITIIGYKSPLGLFSLFPAFAVIIYTGLKSAYKAIIN